MRPRRLVAPVLALLVLQPALAHAARLLQFVEETPAQLIGRPVATVVSPDGAFAYVASAGDSTIAIFTRDGGDGSLTFLGIVQNGVGGVSGLAPAAIALSPDGAHLYSVGGSNLHVFSRDGGTGALTLVETEQNSNLVSGLDVAVSPDGAHVYVTSAYYTSALLAFSRNATTGELTFVEATVDDGSIALYSPQGLAISSDGAHVYVPSYYDDAIAVFSRNSLTGHLTYVEGEAVDSPNAVVLSPDGAHAYVTSYPNLLSVYTRNAGTGALTFEQVLVDGVGGITAMDNPTDLEITPDGGHVYVTAAAYYDDGLVVFSRNAGTGHLTFVEEKRNGVGGIVGLEDANGIFASPDGADLYVTTGFYSYYPSGVLTFSRNAGTGAVTQLQYLTSAVGPSSMVLSPDGAHLYGGAVNSITAFARDGGTGVLTRASALDVVDGFGGVDGLAGVSAVAISPDGAHVYATGRNDNALAAFSRNAGTGALTFVEAQRDGVGGVNGLAYPVDLAMSGDGAHLYVAAAYDSAVSVFARNAGTGALTQTQVVQQNVGGVTGISNPQGLALSPDGAHLYVAAGDSAATFSRDGGTGALTFVASFTLSSFYSSGASVSPDGAFVYLYNPYYYYGTPGDVVRVYARDALTGALTFVSRVKSNEGGLGFNFYYSGRPVITPDGGTFYWRGSTFARNPDSGGLGFAAIATGPGYYLGEAVALGPLGEVYMSSQRSVQRYTAGFGGCDGGPLPVCRGASGGRVVLGPTGPSAIWTWVAADPVMPGDFGDPVGTDHYALCLWDESGPTPTLIMKVLAPAGQQCSSTKACWAATTTGFKYRDRYRTPEGMSGITMTAGAADEARITLVAKKNTLMIPTLPLPGPIRIQLQSSAGACFEGTYSSPRVNNARGYSAQPD